MGELDWLGRAILYGVPALLAAVAGPLALRLVPPNRIYGYRTAASFASSENWYFANQLTGVALIAAAVAMTLAGVYLAGRADAWSKDRLLLIAVLVQGGVLTVAILPVVVFVESRLG